MAVRVHGSNYRLMTSSNPTAEAVGFAFGLLCLLCRVRLSSRNGEHYWSAFLSTPWTEVIVHDYVFIVCWCWRCAQTLPYVFRKVVTLKLTGLSQLFLSLLFCVFSSGV